MIQKGEKLSAEVSETEINFLDTTVKKGTQNKLYTTLYTKPTDTHTYLHFSSAHPFNQKTCGPRGQLLRVRRICSLDNDFESNSELIIEYYRKRGYPEKVLAEAYDNARSQNRKDLLAPRVREIESVNNKLFCILTYNPMNPDVKHILDKYWPILESSRPLQCVANCKPIIGYRRNKNLRDWVVRAKLPQKQTRISQIAGSIRHSCTRMRGSCPVCPKMDTTGICTSTQTNRSYNTPAGGSCGSNNLIYLITCKQCAIQYVGETKLTLAERFRRHFYIIGMVKDPNKIPPSLQNTATMPVAKHFGGKPHSLNDLEIRILEFIKRNPDSDSTTVFRREREKYWYNQLRTFEPFGLNAMV